MLDDKYFFKLFFEIFSEFFPTRLSDLILLDDKYFLKLILIIFCSLSWRFGDLGLENPRFVISTALRDRPGARLRFQKIVEIPEILIM